MQRVKTVLVALVLSCLAASPAAPVQGACAPGIVHCLPPPYAVGAAPIWATLTPVAGGNYPGGNQLFNLFVLNSDSPPLGNITLLTGTVTTPIKNLTVSGLPVVLAPGQSLSQNITLQIPRDFAQNNLTANLAMHFSIANATNADPTIVSTSAQVYMLGGPLGSVPNTPSTAGSPSGPQPIWLTLYALAYGNYPGGNEEFNVFVANSDAAGLSNVSLINETVTAPALPSVNNKGSAIGLPVLLAPGQAIVSTIHLPIPSNFTQGSFTATVAVNLEVSNGTGFYPQQLTKSTSVVVLGLPGTTSPPSSTSSQTTNSNNGSSSILLYAGAAIAVVIVVVVVGMMMRRRGAPGQTVGKTGQLT